VTRPAVRRFPEARRPLAWLRLLAGLWLFAAGVVLGLRSGLGVSPWDVLHDGLGDVSPLSFGTATIVVGVLLVLVTRLAEVRPGPSWHPSPGTASPSGWAPGAPAQGRLPAVRPAGPGRRGHLGPQHLERPSVVSTTCCQ
jgi:hypothetical protein